MKIIEAGCHMNNLSTLSTLCNFKATIMWLYNPSHYKLCSAPKHPDVILCEHHPDMVHSCHFASIENYSSMAI